jgi:hypothetical protein
METLQQVIAKLPPNFFAVNSMSRLENVLAGVSLPVAVNALLGSIVAHSVYEQTKGCVKELALIDPYLPNAPPILHTATDVPYDKWNIPNVPNPYSQSPKVMNWTITCIGRANKQTGFLNSTKPYDWYTFSMKIPRANGTVVTIPVMIEYKTGGGFYWDNVRCYVVCKPSSLLVMASKGWTTFPNMYEVKNIVWPQANRNINPNPYRVFKQPDLKFVNVKVLIQNDKTNEMAVQQLVAFANASTFASSNIVNGTLSSALPLQMAGGIITTTKGITSASRVPFTKPEHELLWGIGAACTHDALINQARMGNGERTTCKDAITLVNNFLTKYSASTPAPASTASSPAPASPAPASTVTASPPPASPAPASPAPASTVPASPVPASPSGGTKRYRTKHKNRSYKKHGYKKRSYKKRSYKK